MKKVVVVGDRVGVVVVVVAMMGSLTEEIAANKLLIISSWCREYRRGMHPRLNESIRGRRNLHQ